MAPFSNDEQIASVSFSYLRSAPGGVFKAEIFK